MNEDHVNIVGRISHFFAVNRPLSVLILIISLLFGLFAFWLTPKQYNPEITRPAFLVSINYSGADINEASDRVAHELIEKIQTVPGVDDVLTEVSDGATVRSTVIFEVGYDATKAKLDLLSQLNQHSYLARGFIAPPAVIEINPETIPILQVVFGSPTRSVPQLRAELIKLGHELGQIEDVSEVSVHGGYMPSLVIEIDPHRLAATGLSVTEVVQVLQQSQLRDIHGAVTSDQYRVEAVFDATTDSPAEVGALFVGDGVRLRDVASVFEGTTGQREYVLHSTATASGEVVMLSVAKVEGSSAPVVSSAVLAALEAYRSKEGSDISYVVVGNDGATANAEIFGLTKNLLTSIVIVAGVLLLFLSLRAAAVVMVAIPVTLLIVFGLGFLFGETINRITLFALILSLGLLVDSAIVVVENIYSHLKEWSAVGDSSKTRERVIAGAVHEIGIGLLLSTVTSVIVFLPMRYITGMMGPYMGPIAFFVPAALVVSLLVAVVITPFVAAYLLKAYEKPLALTAWFGRFFDRLTIWYRRQLSAVLQSRVLQQRLLGGVLLLFIVSLLLPALALVHFQMLPRADRDQFYVYVDLPVDTATEATRQFATDLASLINTDAEVVSVEEFIARPPILDFNGMFKGAGSRDHAYEASLRVNLTPARERSLSSTDVVARLRAQVVEQFGAKASTVRFIEEPPGPPVLATLVAKVSADSQEEQREVALAVTELIDTISGVVDPYTTEEDAIGRVRYRFDREAASRLGVSESAITEVYRLLTGPEEVGEWVSSGAREYSPLMVTLPHADQDSPSDIDTLMVKSADGSAVSLGSVLTPAYELRPSRVSFDGALPVSYVTAEVEGRSIVYVVIDTMRALMRGELAGYEVTSWNLFSLTLQNVETNSELTLRWGGEWEMTLENFRDLGIAMGVALLMVYAVLVAQYNRFATPAYILVTVPLGLVGILWGFLLLDQVFGVYLTATALIGFIALIGLVVNNAIIFLEYVEQMQAAGHSYQSALLEAGQARFRPIFLTSLTTVLGSLTIAGDPVWSGLAWAIVFGLSLSTILTLVIYPTLLMYFVSSKLENNK